MKISINKKFETLLTDLSGEEYNNLKNSVLKEGVRETILIWGNPHNKRYEIIDGHNRYRIAKKYKIPYKTKEILFENEKEAMDWIITNQIARRNLTKEQKTYFIGKYYQSVKNENGKGYYHKNQYTKMEVSKNETSTQKNNAVNKIAKEYNMSIGAIVNADKYAMVIDRVGKLSPQLKTDILLGEVAIKKTEIISLTDKTDKEIEAIIKGIEQGQSIPMILKEMKRAALKNKIISEYKNKENDTNDVIDIYHTKKRFRILLIDPPYDYYINPPIVKQAKDHYPTMAIEEIKNLPIPSIAERNSVIFLWITSPLIEKGLDIINAWGFSYKAMFVWDKIKHNMGHYNSVRHELLLLATKGNCPPDTHKLFDSVMSIERTRHSEKPKEFRELIEKMYMYGDKIELFSRAKSKGWYRWGYEA
jgi:N6-adenosine-specific RNA methylase IME4